MGTPCDICLDELCGDKHNCHCNTCELYSKCYRRLHPTIRITNRCTQRCRHCCFESSPDSNVQMTITQAKKTANFLKNNDIKICQIMGGEFFCNPNWFEVMSIIVDSVEFARIVSNGDWVKSNEIKETLTTFISNYKNKIRISISYDKWHTNTGVKEAEEFLSNIGVKYNIPEIDYMNDDSIVPVGRGELLGGGFYSFMGNFCSQSDKKYGFLIDEVGNIYKCSMGVLDYAKIDDFLEGGFAKRFKEFNKKFYKCFIPSCSTCYRIFSGEGRVVSKKENKET